MTDMTVARNILKTIGGNRMIAMTGAKNFVYSDKDLRFQLPKNESKTHYIQIILNSHDLYDIEFANIRRLEWKVKKTLHDIDMENLVSTLEHETGFHFSL